MSVMHNDYLDLLKNNRLWASEKLNECDCPVKKPAPDSDYPEGIQKKEITYLSWLGFRHLYRTNKRPYSSTGRMEGV